MIKSTYRGAVPFESLNLPTAVTPSSQYSIPLKTPPHLSPGESAQTSEILQGTVGHAMMPLR